MKVCRAIFLFLCLIQATFCANVPCTDETSIDISDGEILADGAIRKNSVTFTANNIRRTKGVPRGCICNVKACIRKCCPVGQYMFNKTCENTNIPLRLPPKTKASINTFHIINGNNCNQKKVRQLLDPSLDPEENFLIEEDGQLRWEGTQMLYSPLDYCVDYIQREVDENPTLKALTCTEEQPFTVTYSIGMIISIPFLLVTFLVYAILPDRNLHGKSLMCYVITLMFAYAVLVCIQLQNESLQPGACASLAFFCLFFFLVSFFWMNVMCIDIWWTFSGLRGFSGSRKETEQKRFILYSFYAWGIPLLLVIIVISINYSDADVDAWYHPNIGTQKCWLKDGYPQLLYFYGVMGLLITLNIVLFIVTALKIRQVKKDTVMIRKDENKKHNYENDKQRFNLYLKLLLAMGINWSMEVISWLVDWQAGKLPEVWYLTDFCNALYGVFVFFIFVFKRNIWKLVKKRYYVLMGKPHLARSMTQTAANVNRTTGSTLSQTLVTDKSLANDSSILTSEV